MASPIANMAEDESRLLSCYKPRHIARGSPPSQSDSQGQIPAAVTMNNSEERGEVAVQAPTNGDLNRNFKGGQVAMFAIACLMGTGLTISSGTASTRGSGQL
ncbi:hypothetical protein BDW66DRAFT_55377 [Aspergillus desertorum]